MIAVGWLLAALWGQPASLEPLKVTGFHEAQKSVPGGCERLKDADGNLNIRCAPGSRPDADDWRWLEDNLRREGKDPERRWAL